MKGFVKISLIAALLTGTLWAANPSIDYYKQGQEYGKKMLQLLAQAVVTPDEVPMDKTILELNAVLSQGSATSEAHKIAFKQFQDYYKGIKETLSTYIPSEKNDLESQGKNYFVKLNLDMAHAALNASDMATVRSNFANVMSKAMQEASKVSHQLPQVDFKVDTNHGHYKEGYTVGKLTCDWMALEAQGKQTSADDQIALQKRIQTFFTNAITAQTPQTEILLGSLQFTSGMKKALEECDLDAIIAKHRPTKDLAEKLRLGLKVGIETAQRTIESLQNPQKGFGEIGQTFKAAAADMNKIQKAADITKGTKVA